MKSASGSGSSTSCSRGGEAGSPALRVPCAGLTRASTPFEAFICFTGLPDEPGNDDGGLLSERCQRSFGRAARAGCGQPCGSSGDPAQHPPRWLRRRRGLVGVRPAFRAPLQRLHRRHRFRSRRVLPRQFRRGLFELAYPAIVLEFPGVRARHGGHHLRHGRAGGLGGRAHRRARRVASFTRCRCCRSPFPDC